MQTDETQEPSGILQEGDIPQDPWSALANLDAQIAALRQRQEPSTQQLNAELVSLLGDVDAWASVQGIEWETGREFHDYVYVVSEQGVNLQLLVRNRKNDSAKKARTLTVLVLQLDPSQDPSQVVVETINPPESQSDILMSSPTAPVYTPNLDRLTEQVVYTYVPNSEATINSNISYFPNGSGNANWYGKNEYGESSWGRGDGGINPIPAGRKILAHLQSARLLGRFDMRTGTLVPPTRVAA